MAFAEIDRSMGNFDDIIALKLKKPKNWKWELSTSKSSPHISLPIIKLYDYKGNLLIETRDTGQQCHRKSWHSELHHDKKRSRSPEESKLGTAHFETSCSDKRDIPTPNKQEGSIRRSDKNNNQFAETSSGNIDVTDRNVFRSRKADEPDRNAKQNDRRKSSVDRPEYAIEPENYLGKSGSDPSSRIGFSTTYGGYHRRTKSDDAFRRKMKFNDPSPEDGKVLSRRNLHSKSDQNVLASIKSSKNSPRHSNHSPLKPLDNEYEIIQTIHPRYKTRTCSAGTLIISEESFNKPNRRKRPQRKNTSADMTSAKITASKEQLCEDADLQKNKWQRRRSTLTSSTPISYRISFPPTDEDTSIRSLVPHARQKSDPLPYEAYVESTSTGRFRQNDSFQRGLCERSVSKTGPSRVTPSDKDATLSQQQQHRKKKRRKVQRRRCHSDGSTSSDNAEWRNGDVGETSATKAFIKHKQPHSESQASLFTSELDGRGDGAADLLDLVRHLSSQADHHVTVMGANVSRHSSKGLSGRRSQSSGSICNGKGKHNEGKSCGSLPSYLDDRDSGGCNNNHDIDRGHDEEPRIPPLGDGAPLHWKFSDTQTALCDQGYGSERSPEEEYPPPLPAHDNQCHRHEHHHLEPHACYPFITPESTFLIKLNKGSRGLGLSVTGGIDSGGSWPGLIRIKRLFPHQPASQCGLINVGDLLLEANGITLTGLTNYEALEVLRTASNQVELRICRPPPDVLTCVSPISEVPPPPPRREAAGGPNTPPLAFNSPEDDYYHGEFEIIINKIQGSLGFTLRKEDDSALGHYVRALVREPALTDGRIKAGDKIIAVNDVEISPMSHEQAVQFLRQCGEEVKLRLYRDAAQTPVAALSPTETTPRTSFSRKSNLRQEAVDMLNDIAVRKLIPGNQDTYRRSLSPSASPRRLRRQPYPSDASQETDHSSTKYPAVKDNDQFHEGLLHYAHPFSDDTSLFIVDSSDDCDKPSRPSSLDLYNPNQTPVVARKPRFNFSLAHNAYELNNLDAEVLDAPNLTYNLGHDEGKGPDQGRANDSFGQGPASMPHIPLENSSAGFSYKNPAYQTAHPPCVTEHEDHLPAPIKAAPQKQHVDDDLNARKWKAAILEEVEEPKQKTADFIRPREENEILAIELNRGWNSRLGFSLQGAAGVTYVSAVYADSVAAKDGRLKPGDRVIRVNDESVEHMSTSEIIDLLRIVRGPVCIVVSRTNSKEDCLKSNAAN